jgi:hypothetical protein
MLVAVAASDWHLPVMIAAGAIMLRERLAAPGRPRWRWPTPIAGFERPAVFALLHVGGRHG